MEEFFLGADLAGDELDVVHQQQVGHPVFFPERRHVAALDGGDQLVGEVVAFDVHDPVGRPGPGDVAGDGVEQVGLAQARLAVDEQGVVGAGRVLGHGIGGRVGKLVAVAHDEPFKCVVCIDCVFVGGAPKAQLFVAAKDPQGQVFPRQFPHCFAKWLGIAVFDHLPFHAGGGEQNKNAVFHRYGGGVSKPSGDHDGGELLFQHVDHILEQFGRRCHIASHPIKKILSEI